MLIAAGRPAGRASRDQSVRGPVRRVDTPLEEVITCATKLRPRSSFSSPEDMRATAGHAYCRYGVDILSSRASRHRSDRASSAAPVVCYGRVVCYARHNYCSHLVMARVSEADRRKIVELAQNGHSQRVIAALVNRPLKTVNRIVQAFRYEGRICDAPRGPPPRATTEDEDHYIVAAAVDDPFLSAREIRKHLGLNASDATNVRGRRMTGAGSSSQTSRRLPRERTNVCTCGEFAAHDPAYVQRVANNGRTCVNVWGAVTKHGLGPLHRIAGRLMSASYCDIVDTVLLLFVHGGLFPDHNFLFQQDLAPVHTARVVKNHLQQCGIEELAWVPKGADMNIIENVWGRIEVAMQTAGVADDARSLR
ncbi:hypothetical protein HPB47_006059 [Ixodes persulcatus]|uniref:Uncharacterized protein n=1 Tax=Ixodes persulcatus TaxID=34615 RepID=A0AC60PBF8_IXOPE|nr:hypothetical protein HPB47_006059 [Ixodes persulcatus]